MRPAAARYRKGRDRGMIRGVATEDPLSSRRSTLIFYLTALSWFALDQWTKLEVVHRLMLGESHPVIPGLLAMTHVTNTGGAWSLLAGHTMFLGLLSLAVCLGLVVYERLWQDRKVGQTLGMAFLLGGAAGNMLDRLRLQHVVDMVDLQWQGQNIFPIFNVADIGIDIGVGLLLIYNLLERPVDEAPAVRSEGAG
jgi:signal peptidase II